MWTDSPDGIPPFDAGARAWFRLWVERRQGVADVAPEMRARVVALLCDQAAALVWWVPSDEYRGVGFTNGTWRVNTEVFCAALESCISKATREADAALDAPHCASLDVWLAAHAAGTLRSRGAVGGSAHFSPALRCRLFDAAWARSKTWPVRCRGCGESFTPERRRLVRCPTCRSAAKGAKGVNAAAERERLPVRPTRPREVKGANPAPPKPEAFLVDEYAARVRAKNEANMAEIQRRLRGES
jgi:hypothetical protein